MLIRYLPAPEHSLNDRPIDSSIFIDENHRLLVDLQFRKTVRWTGNVAYTLRIVPLQMWTSNSWYLLTSERTIIIGLYVHVTFYFVKTNTFYLTQIYFKVTQYRFSHQGRIQDLRNGKMLSSCRKTKHEVTVLGPEMTGEKCFWHFYDTQLSFTSEKWGSWPPGPHLGPPLSRIPIQ